MTFVIRKHIKKLYIIFFLFLLNNCQLQEPKKSHGVNFLENRGKTLQIGITNQNDVIKLIGSPHSKSISNKDTWIYFQRTISRGKLVKLGQNVLKENNVLVLEFNDRGILENKGFIGKDGMNKVAFTENKTANIKNKKSFVNKFLSSLKQKMYKKK